MGGEWSNHRLADVIELIGGGTPKRSRSDYWGGDIPWLSVKDFNDDYRHVYSAEETITEDGLNNSSTKILEAGEIIISARGTVGALAQLARPMAFNQSCYGIRAKSEFTFNDYLYYLLRYTVENLQRITHGAVFDTITRETFQHVDISLPPITEQRAIAHILGTLDDKIELNRQMNRTLEAMAQALFKSWFIDFDPVVVNALRAGNPIPEKFAQRVAHYRDNPGALRLPEDLLRQFPDRFQDSELGPIPEGWEVARLGDIAEHPRRSISPNEIPSATAYIGLEHMPRKSIALSEWATADGIASNKFQFQRGEILFGKLRPYFHKVGVAPLDGVCSTDVVVIKPMRSEWFGVVLGYVSSQAFVDYANACSTGTRMPRANWKNMALYELVMPPLDLADEFNGLLLLWIQEIILNIHESKTLAKLRDTLLPKLISGELRLPAAALETLAAQAGVPDAEKLLEEAI